MLKIALTGGIGCGKSTVCKLFTQLDIPVIDTDSIARELVNPGGPALQQISDYFGNDILLPNGLLNRKKLADKIFSNSKDRLFLESILHPKIRQGIQSKINNLKSCYVIVAIPLLIETHQQNEYDRILVIDCTEQQQIERTITRDKRTAMDVQKIMDSQVSRQQRLAVADDTIDNSHLINNLKQHINILHIKYMELCDSNNE